MGEYRPYIRIARRGVLFTLVALCAGCWEEIEYTGPDPSTTRPRTSQPAATNDPSSGRPSAFGSVEQATVSTQPAGPPPLSVDTKADPPKPDVDRYALPAESGNGDPTADPPPREFQPGAAEQLQPPVRHTDATMASATAEVTPGADAANTRRAAWILGSKLSLAALANDRGMAAQNVPAWFEEARSAAKLLGTSVGDLPERTPADEKSPLSRQVIDYLVVQGRRIDGDLSKQHGPEYAALFDIAWKSNVLRLLYSPGSSATNSIAAAISRAAPQAQLPIHLWQPLVDLLSREASLDDVRATVRQMHVDVDRYLAQATEQHGR